MTDAVSASELAARTEIVRLSHEVAQLVRSELSLTHREYRKVFADSMRFLVIAANRELTTDPSDLESRVLDWPDSVDDLARAFLKKARGDHQRLGDEGRLFGAEKPPPRPGSADEDLLVLVLAIAQSDTPDLDFVQLQEECAWSAADLGIPLLRWMDCLAPSWHGESRIDESAGPEAT